MNYVHRIFTAYRPAFLAITFVALVVAVAAFSSPALAATTSQIVPTGNGHYHEWTGSYTDINEGMSSPSCTSGDYIHSGTTGERSSFRISLASVPDGSIISDVTVLTADRSYSSDGGTYATFIRMNGVNSANSATHTTTDGSGCTGSQSDSFTTNVVKNGSTALEIGVIKLGSSSPADHSVRVGAMAAVITYSTPTTGTLRVVTDVVNDNGGTAVAGAWTMDLTASSTPNHFAGSASGVDVVVDPGAYSVSESNGPSGYTESYSAGCSGTISAGETKTCTVTNDDIAPSLTLVKEVVNGFRGSATAGLWTLFAAGPTALSGTSPVSSDPTFSAGDYTLSESGGPDNYALAISCAKNDEASTTGSSLSLAVGDNATCVFQNSEKQPGVLHVVKQVVNDNPEGYQGTASAGDFTLAVTGGNPAPASFSGSEEGTDVTIDAGASYSVSETGGPTDQYGATYSEGCSGAMPEGGAVTCTVINNDNPPTTGGLTVTKVVVNDNGGLKTVADFPLQVTSGTGTTTALVSGQNVQLEGGAYTVSETGDPAYAASFSGDCNSDGVVTVTNGQSATCVVTNDDIAPSLTLVKRVTNDNGGTAEPIDWTLTASGPSTISGAGGVASGEAFKAGSYTLSESDGPAGYAAGDWSCKGGSQEGNQIALDVGESATCTITNDDQAPSLTVIKHVVNDNGGTKSAADFTMHVSGTHVSNASFVGSEQGTTVTLDAGAYAVTEDPVAGYGATLGDDCRGTIAVGEAKTCTVTNDDGKANLTIVKHTTGADGSFGFMVGEATTTVTTIEGSGSTMIALDAGTYGVSEIVPVGWELTGAICSGERNPSELTLATGDAVTCTFDDTATGADLSIAKAVDDTTPDAGAKVVYTLTAANAGPLGITNITVHDLLPTGLTYVSDDGAGAYATSTGDWSIPSLPSASTTTLRITATIDRGTEGKTITNTATISSSDEVVTDPNADNDSADAPLTVNKPEPQSSGNPPSQSPGAISPVFFGGSVLGASTTTLPGGQVLGASCGLYLDQHLRMGGPNDQGQVTKLQQFLTQHGYGTFNPTGFFGPLTLAAVKAFQAQYADEILKPWGLSAPTGLVYLTTARQINLVECPDLMLPLPTLVPWGGA